MQNFPTCCYETKSQNRFHYTYQQVKQKMFTYSAFLFKFVCYYSRQECHSSVNKLRCFQNSYKTKHIIIIIMELIMTADVFTLEEYYSQMSSHHWKIWMTVAPYSKGVLKICEEKVHPATPHTHTMPLLLLPPLPPQIVWASGLHWYFSVPKRATKQTAFKRLVSSEL